MKVSSLPLVILIYCFTPLSGQSENNGQKIFRGHEGSINAICFSPDGQKLITGGEDQTIRCHTIATGEANAILTGHNAGIHALRFDRKGQILISAGDRSLRTWTPCGAVQKTFTGPVTHIWSFDISANGKQVAAGSYEKKFRVWDLVTARQLALVDGHEQSVLAIRYNPVDTFLATGSLDRTIRIWGSNSYQPVATLTGHSDNIYELCFTPDGKYLVSASRDKTARLWNLATGKIIKSYIGHEKGLTTVDISPDGLFLLTGSVDHTVKLWELATARCLYTFHGHTQPVNCVRFGPDGKFFVSASADGTAILWPLTPEVFVGPDYENDILEELNDSPFFAPKAENESRTDYKIRQEKAEDFSKEVHHKYYQKYLEGLQRNIE